MADLDPEDAKLVTLARAARARAAAASGAAVRDETGRTYSAVPVELPSLTLTALELAVATAVASGAGSLEAAALVAAPGADGVVEVPDLTILRDLRPGTPLYVADPSGSVRGRHLA